MILLSSIPEITAEIVRRLTQAAYRFNLLAVTEIGGRSGRERAPGMVEQVVAASFQTYAGHDPHPDVFEKAAVMLRGIVQGHPFSDGNKRTGVLLAMYFLQEIGVPGPGDLPTDEVISFCLQVSAGEIRDIQEIRRQIMSWYFPHVDQ